MDTSRKSNDYFLSVVTINEARKEQIKLILITISLLFSLVIFLFLIADLISRCRNTTPLIHDYSECIIGKDTIEKEVYYYNSVNPFLDLMEVLNKKYLLNKGSNNIFQTNIELYYTDYGSTVDRSDSLKRGTTKHTRHTRPKVPDSIKTAILNSNDYCAFYFYMILAACLGIIYSFILSIRYNKTINWQLQVIQMVDSYMSYLPTILRNISELGYFLLEYQDNDLMTDDIKKKTTTFSIYNEPQFKTIFIDLNIALGNLKELIKNNTFPRNKILGCFLNTTIQNHLKGDKVIPFLAEVETKLLLKEKEIKDAINKVDLPAILSKLHDNISENNKTILEKEKEKENNVIELSPLKRKNSELKLLETRIKTLHINIVNFLFKFSLIRYDLEHIKSGISCITEIVTSTKIIQKITFYLIYSILVLVLTSTLIAIIFPTVSVTAILIRCVLFFSVFVIFRYLSVNNTEN